MDGNVLPHDDGRDGPSHDASPIFCETIFCAPIRGLFRLLILLFLLLLRRRRSLPSQLSRLPKSEGQKLLAEAVTAARARARTTTEATDIYLN
jgi:hypothetical protein